VSGRPRVRASRRPSALKPRSGAALRSVRRSYVGAESRLRWEGQPRGEVLVVLLGADGILMGFGFDSSRLRGSTLMESLDSISKPLRSQFRSSRSSSTPRRARDELRPYGSKRGTRNGAVGFGEGCRAQST